MLQGRKGILGLGEASHPCEKTLPETLMRGQAGARGSRSSRDVGKGCFGPGGPVQRKGKLWTHPGSSVPCNQGEQPCAFAAPDRETAGTPPAPGQRKLLLRGNTAEIFRLAGLYVVTLQNSALLFQLLTLTANADVILASDATFSVC